MSSLILEIQAEAYAGSGQVASLLRKAKVAATKLDQSDDLIWIENELSGYNGNVADLPAYRQINGALSGLNRVRGWIPIEFPASQQAQQDYYSIARISASVPELEDMVSSCRASGKRTIVYSFPPEIERMFQQAINRDAPVAVLITPHRLNSIVDAVRNRILHWALSLEKAGVLGEGLGTKPTDEDNSNPVHQKFVIHNAQNVNAFGQVHKGAHVEISQRAETGIDLKALRESIDQIKAQLSAAPEALRKELPPLFHSLESEMSLPNPDPGKIRTLLRSAKTVAEGAVGNLIASGTISLLSRFF